MPTPEQICHWANTALHGREENATVCIRIMDEDEMTELNSTYRGKNSPTNVLSFPMDMPPGIDLTILGDIAVCAPVVANEAREQEKSYESHWAHMIIHGTLHLLGYDHIDEADAQEMETLETEIMHGLQYPNPYQPLENS
ncbi:MAG: rRNA maturation RNase YbeY [Gammaproteobacteria bacterium]|nr:rRNA maturation RNase YbeY [Gammaproteobacteria bacterium]